MNDWYQSSTSLMDSFSCLTRFHKLGTLSVMT